MDRYFVTSNKKDYNYCIEFVSDTEALDFANKNNNDNVTVSDLICNENGDPIEYKILMEPKK